MSNKIYNISFLMRTLFTGMRNCAVTLVLFFVLINSQNGWGQVTVTGALTGNGNYTTLRAAIVAIGTSQTGANIVISITGNTTEAAQTAAPSVQIGAGTWTSLTIQPSGGAARTISGAATAGQPLINFNGADRVTINGLNTGGNSLTITNTTVSATSGTSTIRLIADATNNVITNCSVLGSGTMTASANGGNIFINTGTTTGNDGNTISNCNIGPAGANLPTKAICGSGSTTSTAIGNSGITINNNNIFDYFEYFD